MPLVVRWACSSVRAPFHDNCVHGENSQRIINEGGCNEKTLRDGRLLCSRLFCWKCRWRFKKQRHCKHKCLCSHQILLYIYMGRLLIIHLDPLSNTRTQINLLNHIGLKCKFFITTVYKVTLKMSYIFCSLCTNNTHTHTGLLSRASLPRYKTPNNAACWGCNAAAQVDRRRATGPLGLLEPLRLQPPPESREPVCSGSTGKQIVFQETDSWQIAESF